MESPRSLPIVVRQRAIRTRLGAISNHRCEAQWRKTRCADSSVALRHAVAVGSDKLGAGPLSAAPARLPRAGHRCRTPGLIPRDLTRRFVRSDRNAVTTRTRLPSGGPHGGIMPRTPLAATATASTRAEAMDWRICHFCKRYTRCERWFKSWRCSDCSAANTPPHTAARVRRPWVGDAPASHPDDGGCRLLTSTSAASPSSPTAPPGSC
jgi:hypothetical protein